MCLYCCIFDRKARLNSELHYKICTDLGEILHMKETS